MNSCYNAATALHNQKAFKFSFERKDQVQGRYLLLRRRNYEKGKPKNKFFTIPQSGIFLMYTILPKIIAAHGITAEEFFSEGFEYVRFKSGYNLLLQRIIELV